MLDELKLIDASSAVENDELVTLNLRGTKITVQRTVADEFPGSRLWRVLRDSLRPTPPRDSDGNMFFNRNPFTFHEVLDAVVTGDAVFSSSTSDAAAAKRLEAELKFWGIATKRQREAEVEAVVHELRGDSSRRGIGAVTARRYGEAEIIRGNSSPFL